LRRIKNQAGQERSQVAITSKVEFPPFKPPLRARPEAVGQFQQAAAGEELAGVG
jgi:hypothetical protein